MTQNTYKKLMQAVFANECHRIEKHWTSKDLSGGDRAWAFFQAVRHNHLEIVQYMLNNTPDVDIATLLESDFGNNLHFLAEKNSASDTKTFQPLTHLLVSHSHRLSAEQQYETFSLFVQFEHDASIQMAEVVGYDTVYCWLERNLRWKDSLPELMQKIVLHHTVDEATSVASRSTTRKM